MTISAQSVVRQVMHAMNDDAGDRFPASDVVAQLNRAQKDMMIARPDVTATICVISTIAGSLQPVLEEIYQLIDIPALHGGAKTAISKVDMAILDATVPGWRGMPETGDIKHYMHDARDNRTFYVYPPAAVNTLLRAKCSLYPVVVPDPASPGRAWQTVSGDITIGDEWESALVNLTLAYCYMTDLEGVGNAQLAQTYLSQASTLLGVQLKTQVAIAPQKGD